MSLNSLSLTARGMAAALSGRPAAPLPAWYECSRCGRYHEDGTSHLTATLACTFAQVDLLHPNGWREVNDPAGATGDPEDYE